MSTRPPGPPCPPKGAGKGPPPKGLGKGPPGKGKGPPPPGGGSRPPSAGPGSREAFAGPKLRPLFWQLVNQVPPKSVWDELGSPAPFDQASLERRFALGETKSMLRKGTVGSSSTGSLSALGGADTPRGAKRVRILDDRTSQLLAIAFNKLPPPERLVSVVDELENFPDGLSDEAVLALHAAANEQKEAIDQLRQLEVPETELGQLDVPERYLWMLGSKPVLAAKLTAGALIVGPAREIAEVSKACEQVGRCCKLIRTSECVLKCISTSLAVGNLVNRGTARSGARAVVLPEALLKLDELRGSAETEEGSSPADGNRGPTLLEFVAEALVKDVVLRARNRQAQAELQQEAEALRDLIRAAQGCDLQVSEASVRVVTQASSTALKGLSDFTYNPKVGQLEARVRQILEEANQAAEMMENAKRELQFSQEWSSAKPNTKDSEWLASWCQFLDQFSQAISRVRIPAAFLEPPIAAQPSVAAAAEEPRFTAFPYENPFEGCPTAEPSVAPASVTRRRPAALQAAPSAMMSPGTPPMTPPTPPPQKSPTGTTVMTRTEKRRESSKVQLDDDERVEVLMARMLAQQQAQSAPQPLQERKPTQPQQQSVSEPVKKPSNPTTNRFGLGATRVPLLHGFDGKENN
eukprot:TRINITY_DN93818_c0_g1_i1.p1 TRINITY_DN93818_c0_g1~~TRINITY_DN93818_c0_g1_i1.p1  ORF type:complete len:636 (+),score=171.40 TRINITY_DN93818_c0_g1_i1:68-1975(+)